MGLLRESKEPINRLSQEEIGYNQYPYSYYPNKLPTKKKEGSQTTKYVYLNGYVIEELDGSGTIKAQNVYGKDLLFRQTANGQSGYYLHNGHGDVMSVVDKNGKTLNRYEYDAWGNPIAEKTSESMNNPFRYTGEVYDPETNMYYLRARYYDPAVGRYV